MPAMLTVVTVFAFVAIAIHVYIWILESFLWTKPKGREGVYKRDGGKPGAV